jgi:hypothetical protein
MKLLKQATEQYNLDNTTRIVYEDVHFPLGFMLFLETLEIHRLIPADYVSESTEVGYMWCDTRKDGGVMVETSDHPLTTNNRTGICTIEGSEESLEVVQRVLTQHNVTYTSSYP